MIITLPQLLVFFLIMARIIGLILTAPILSDKRIFTMGKIAIVIWLSGLIVFVVPLPMKLPDTGIVYALALITEAFIGALIGFTTDLLITGIEFAGSLIDTQAGLSVANLLDPSTGRQVTLFSSMLKWVSFLIFFAINGHHLVLTALFESFNILPIAAPINIAEGCHYLVSLGTYIFFLGVQLAAPILLVVFLVDFGFGMLNKVAEQVNVFQLGFQIKPTVSLLIFFAILPGLTDSIFRILEGVTERLLTLFYYLQTI